MLTTVVAAPMVADTPATQQTVTQVSGVASVAAAAVTEAAAAVTEAAAAVTEAAAAAAVTEVAAADSDDLIY